MPLYPLANSCIVTKTLCESTLRGKLLISISMLCAPNFIFMHRTYQIS